MSNHISDDDVIHVTRQIDSLYANLVTRGLKFRFAVIVQVHTEGSVQVSRIFESIFESHAYRLADRFNDDFETRGIVGNAEVVKEYYR